MNVYVQGLDARSGPQDQAVLRVVLLLYLPIPAAHIVAILAAAHGWRDCKVH